MSEITLSDGRKQVNPIGTCFDSSAHVLINLIHYGIRPIMCHGIGVSNLPGEKPGPMAHAWLEFFMQGAKVALDTTWMVAQPVKKYRKDLKLKFVIEYPATEFVVMWKKAKMPGPFDDRIAALTKEGKAANDKR